MADGYISQIKTPDNKVYDFRDQHLKVYTGSCATPAATAIKDVTTDGKFVLAKGAVVFVNFSITNTAAVGNLKLKFNGEADTNAKPIKYLVNGNAPFNIPGAGYLRANQTYMFQYDGTNWVVLLNYYTYSNDFASRVGHYNNILARKAITAGSLIVGDATGYEKVASGVTFDLAYPIVWCTAAVAANTSNYANMFLQHYDRNIATGAKTGFTSAANKVIYLIVTVNGNIATIDSNIITDTLPSSADGKVYISLGKLGAQSTGADYFFLYPVHPMFEYKNGKIRTYEAPQDLSEIDGADDLKAIEAISGTSGLLKKTAANTWSLDTNTYLTSHRTYTAFTGTPTGNQTPGFGDTFTIQQISQSTTGQVSGTDRTVTIPATEASTSAVGLVGTGAQTFGGTKTFNGGMHIYGSVSMSGSTVTNMYSGGAYHAGHNSLVLHGDSAGVSGIGFTSQKATDSGNAANINSPSDRAFIQYHAYGVTAAAEGTAPTLATSGELGTLVIGVGNDATDTIRLQAPSTAGILHQIGTTAYPIPHTTNTNGTVGGTTTPVYVDAGVIKAGTALKDLAYIAKGTGSTKFLREDGTWQTPPYPVTSVATLTGAIAASDLVTQLGLSKAMNFLGVATVTITDGGTEDPKIGGNATTVKAGDVVIDSSSSREYVWSTTGNWELLGGDSSYWVSSTGTTGQFWRGDNSWSNEISGGILKITANSNTLSIGSQNGSFTHIYNSASIPFIFNNTVLTVSGNLGNTTYPFNNLYIGKTGNRSIYYVGTKVTNAMITFLDNTSDAYGNGIKIGGGGVVVVGAGESAANLSVTPSSEALYLTADGAINIEAGGDTIANRVGIQVTTAGHVIPVKAEAAHNNAQDLGASDNKWANVYATTLDGVILKLHQGTAADPSLTGNARIEFNYSGGQPVVISYTPNDSYRDPAGLKIMGGASATPAWLEVEGDVYAAAFKGNADTATSAGKWTTARTLTIGNKDQSVDGSDNVSWSLADIGAAPAIDGGYLPLSGGKMTGNINMGDMGTPSSYPATGNKITWTGGTDGAQIYYHVASADAGRLVFNTTDDANCLMALAYNGTFKAYISNNTPSFYPATTNTGSLGLSDNVWSILYAHTISNSVINTTQASMRHIDAGKNAVQTDHKLYIGYGAQSFTNKTLFYYSTGTTDTTSTRTQFAEINQNGLYALTRFGVNGQNTDYNFYTNGTALITGNSDITGIKYYTHVTNAGKTYIGWVKFASIALGNNNYWGDKIYDIFIDRTYNSPSSEVYNIRVSAGWTNSNIIQLSGHAGSRIINKFRVVRDHTNHKAYFEYYVDPAYNIYQNNVNIKILCYHGAAVTLMNEVQTENDSTFAYKEEIDLANGMVVNGTFNGNATTATGISKTGGSTATFWRGDNSWSDTLVGPLYINNTTDASGTSDTGALVIGSKTGENIAIDTNEVMARNNKATSTLYLNNDGGLVSVGSGGLTTSGKLESTGQLRVVNNSSANSDDALVYISNTSSSDWTMKLGNSSSNYGLYIEGTGNNLLRVGTNDVLNITDNATSSSNRAVTIKGKLDLKQPSNAALGIDTNLKIGTARKDLNFDLGNGSGTGINGGNGGGITWGNEAAAYAGIYYQCSGAYGSRLLFGTTNSYANGVYARMIIVSDGKVGIGTLNPDELLTINGNAKATKFIGALEGNVTGNVSGSAGSVAWANVSDHPTNLNQFTNGPGYTTNTGTVTSVKLIQGAGITVSSSGTAITTTGERTISITGMDTTNGSTTQWLNKKGGWSTPTAAQVGALASSTVVTNVAISADTTTNKEYALVFGTTPSDGTTPTAAKTERLQKNITKLYTNPSTGTLYSTKFCVDEHVQLQYNSTDSSLEFVFA